MNKKGKISTKAALGVAFIFGGLIVADKVNLIIGIVMMGTGIFLVLSD